MTADTTKNSPDARDVTSPGFRIDARHRAFRILLALTFLVAFWSLGRQVTVLIGSEGLLPASELREARARGDLSFWNAPTLMLWFTSDGWLRAGCWIGALFSVLALASVWTRAMLFASGLLYLSYAVAGREFLAFQWDNLLLECTLLALFAASGTRREKAIANAPSFTNHSFAEWRIPDPVSTPRRVWTALSGGAFSLLLYRLLIFKLYFESGLAKYQSHLGDWIDGSAMRYYYETAPIPSPLAYYAHALPESWHVVESRVTLFFELVCPFFVFAPRRGRLFALSVFTLFQGINIVTANYGFFAYLSLWLGVYLLDERDLRNAETFLRKLLALRSTRRWFVLLRATRFKLHRINARAKRAVARRVAAWHASMSKALRASVTRWLAALVATLYFGVSLDLGLRRFVHRDAELPVFSSISHALAPFRVINNYHLFAHVTRDRIEPEFQVNDDGMWFPLHLHYKPGPIDRRPPFVAPHQPRVDFRLWFYGLGHERGVPRYVANLLRRICTESATARALFVGELPERPEAARVIFFDYRFSDLHHRARTGVVWQREPIPGERILDCERVRLRHQPAR